MSENSIASRIKKIIIEHLDAAESEVVDDAAFVKDLGADSLDTVELVMAFEDEFEVEISDEDAEKIDTVKAAIDYITEHSK